jgi:hypothetical protein
MTSGIQTSTAVSRHIAMAGLLDPTARLTPQAGARNYLELF